MNTKPLQDYLAGREAFKKGRIDEAEKLIASACGMPEPNWVVKGSLDKLADPDRLNEAVLTLVMERMKKE